MVAIGLVVMAGIRQMCRVGPGALSTSARRTTAAPPACRSADLLPFGVPARRAGAGALAPVFRRQFSGSAAVAHLPGNKGGGAAMPGSPTPHPASSFLLTDRSCAAIRRDFVEFFTSRPGPLAHQHLPSSSLVPAGDHTLMFTNAGMVQFKDSFTGAAPAPAPPAVVTVQKCVRAGGKHNDLDQVGYTPRHHTFFEMLGNFSFGAYGKREAIEMAWEYLTRRLGLPLNRLVVTVYEGDPESLALWHDHVGVPRDRILVKGAAENWWSLGDGPGPCGPCTEIFWDLQNGAPPLSDDRLLEVWNLVFMEFARKAGCSADKGAPLHRLPVMCVDTGMGLERIASVLQGAPSNYETDAFAPIIGAARRLSEQAGAASLLAATPNPNHNHYPDPNPLAAPPAIDGSASEPWFRIVADHLRAAIFLIGDRVQPSNVRRGYVLRRLLRRAMCAGMQVGLPNSFLSGELFDVVLKELPSELYPEVFAESENIRAAIAREEEGFGSNLARGMVRLGRELESARSAGGNQLAANRVFDLYHSTGLPIDISAAVAASSGLQVDQEAVAALMEEARECSRAAYLASQGADRGSDASESKRWNERCAAAFEEWQMRGISPLFCGDVRAEAPQRRSLDRVDSEVVAVLCEDGGRRAVMAIDPCPFYGAGGGQVGDQGTLVLPSGVEVVVEGTLRPYRGGIVLQVATASASAPCHANACGTDDGDNRTEFADTEALAGELVSLRTGARIRATVDSKQRAGASVHHSATHLLHAALVRVLGDGVMQAGSQVQPDKLRFDFSLSRAVSEDELAEVERLVCEAALADVPVVVEEMALADALCLGAKAFFEEKYDDRVRVVSMGPSRELCGGTHVASTGDIFPFKVVAESSVASGTRRVEAVAGKAASVWLLQQQQRLRAVARKLGCKGSSDGEVERLLSKTLAALADATQHSRELVKLTSSLPVLGDVAEGECALSGGHEGAAGAEGRTVPVRVHVLPAAGGPALLEGRAKYLKDAHPDVAHVLMWGQHVRSVTGQGCGSTAAEVMGSLLAAMGGSATGKATGKASPCFDRGYIRQGGRAGEPVSSAVLRWANVG